MMNILQQADAVAALPEIVLAVFSMAILMLGVFRKGENYWLVAISTSLAILITAIFVMMGAKGGTQAAFGGAFIVDDFARAMKLLTLAGTEAALVLSGNYLFRNKMVREEYPVLLALSAVGMMMMISANDLISLYMGLELQSLALYVVASINRDSAKSSEAGLKYFVLGALASGMLLYGASLVYGFTGSTQFAGIGQALTAQGSSIGLIFGLVFMIAGLAFKVSAVPFHMWTPDVYEGAPTPITAFFAAAPKVAAIALFTRVMMGPFKGVTADWQQVVTFIAIASMILGAVAAIGQTNIKRLLAYSSIGHMGYALVGLASASQEGVQSIVTYMLIYVVTTIGVFACVLAMRRNGQQVENIGDLAGLARNNKTLAFILAMLMFSLAGIPPLAGFFGKLFVFMAAVKSGLFVLAVIGVLASVVSAFYYLRIIKLMYFDEPAAAFDPLDPEVKWATWISGAFAVLFAVIAQPVMNYALTAAQSFYAFVN
jgi:NADH-quinone oxidoreductase subunit N